MDLGYCVIDENFVIRSKETLTDPVPLIAVGDYMFKKLDEHADHVAFVSMRSLNTVSSHTSTSFRSMLLPRGSGHAKK